MQSSTFAEGVRAVNELSKCLRFNFLSLYNILQALRKNECFKTSHIFSDCVDREIKERLKMSKQGII